MRSFYWKRWVKSTFFAVLGSHFFGSIAQAGTTGSENLPFESTLDMLQKSISGPVLTSMSIIMITATCLMLAFGEWGDSFKKIINIVLWLSVAFAAVSFLNHMFGAGAIF